MNFNDKERVDRDLYRLALTVSAKKIQYFTFLEFSRRILIIIRLILQ